jgi:hypothetical protein
VAVEVKYVRKDLRLVGCKTMLFGRTLRMFRWNFLLPSSGHEMISSLEILYLYGEKGFGSEARGSSV